MIWMFLNRIQTSENAMGIENLSSTRSLFSWILAWENGELLSLSLSLSKRWLGFISLEFQKTKQKT